MTTAQIIAVGADERLAEMLRQLAQARRVWLREVTRPDACLNLLRAQAEATVVLRLGKDLEKEMLLLDRVSRFFPAAATLVVGTSEHPRLEALAWDLGARWVLFPPQPLERIREILDAFPSRARSVLAE